MKRNQAQTRDDVSLSAYIDGELSPQERTRLEARLASDPALQAQLDELRRTVALLHEMPPVDAPRNFMLTPAMVAPPRPKRATPRWLAPALSFATASSALLCAVIMATTMLAGGMTLGTTAESEPASLAMPEAAPAEPALVGGANESARTPDDEESIAAPPSLSDGAEEQGVTREMPTPTAPLVAVSPLPEPMSELLTPQAAARSPLPTEETLTWERETPPATPTSLTLAALLPLISGLSLLTALLALAALLAWRARRK